MLSLLAKVNGMIPVWIFRINFFIIAYFTISLCRHTLRVTCEFRKGTDGWTEGWMDVWESLGVLA